MDAGSDKTTNQLIDQGRAARLRERDRTWEIRCVWILLISLVGLGTYLFLQSHVDDTLRVKVLRILSAQFPEHLVALDSAHLEAGRGILLDGVAVALPTPNGPRVVARVPRMTIRGNIDLIGLVQGQYSIDRIYLDAVDLTLWPLPDGRTSLDTLTSDQLLPERLPPIDIRRSSIRIADSIEPTHQAMILHDLNVSIRSLSSESRLPNQDARQSKAEAVSELEQPSVRVVATVGGSYFSKLKIHWDMSRDKSRWTVRGNIEHLYYASQWTDKLPNQWKDWLVQLSGFSGHVSAEFGIEKNRDQAAKFSFLGRISKGRLQHPKLPYPLEELTGTLHYRNQLLQLRKATARSGQAEFQLEADVHGLEMGSPMIAILKATNLPLDDRLLRAVPRPVQEQWLKLKVAGTVDTELTLQYDGQRWTPEIIVHARNGSVNADIFPYPLTDVQGDFHYRDGILISDAMTARARGQRLRGILRLARASPRWLVDFTVSSDGPIVMDETLIQALTPRGESPNSLQSFIRSLSPTGSVQLEHCRFIRHANEIHALSKELELSFYGGTLRYDGFRYPIFDVQGHASVRDNVVQLQRMKGRNDCARIACEGHVECVENRVSDLEMFFDVQNLPLDEELHSSLPVAVRHIWSHLRPSGVVDHVDVRMGQHGIGAPLEVVVGLQEDGKDDAVVGRSVSLLPQSLPYLLSNVSCDLSYRPGFVELRRFGASHDLSRVSANGDFQVQVDGTWHGILTWLPTTRLNVDQSLLISLPEYLRAPLMATEFRGPMGITGQTLIASRKESGEPTVQAWDIALEIEDGQLAGGNLASGIRGSIAVLGEKSGQGPIAKGYVMMDSMAVRGLPVTNLTGPFAIKDSKLLMGRLARQVEIAPLAARLMANRRTSDVVTASVNIPIPSHSSQNGAHSIISNSAGATLKTASDMPVLDVREDDLKAKALAGKLTIYGTHPLMDGQTELNLALSDANLVGFLADIGETHNSTSGRLWIEGRVEGSLVHTNTLSGSGNAWLRQANFYQMPVMTRMFRVLSVKPPDDGAFESADVQFRLDGDRIPIDRISLDGDIISLRGNGWANLRRDVQLDLYAYVGNRSPMAAIFGPLVSQNDNATMLQLEVSGTTDKLTFRKSIPLMGTNLQQIFPDRISEP